MAEKLRALKLTDEQILDYLSPALRTSCQHLSNRYSPIKEESSVIFHPSLTSENSGEPVFQYVLGRDGVTFSHSDLLNELTHVLDGGKTQCPIPFHFDAAESIQSMRERTVLVSSFSTYYGNSSKERKINIMLAASAVNGCILEKGDTLSFNERVGARTAERGYQSAKTIENGVYVMGIGGGVCQVSSTLFNALALAGLTPLESHKHTIPASYVPLSRDAMVSSFADLKMRNDSEYPVYISAKADEETLTFFVYSKLTATYRLESQTLETLPPPPIETIEDIENQYNLKQGEYKQLSPARNGYVSRLVRTKRVNDVTQTEVLRNDMYYPQAEKRAIPKSSDIL